MQGLRPLALRRIVLLRSKLPGKSMRRSASLRSSGLHHSKKNIARSSLKNG